MDDRPRQVCESCGDITRLGRWCDTCLSGPWPRTSAGAWFRCEACDGAGEHIVADGWSSHPADERAEPCGACEGSGHVWRDAEPATLTDAGDEAAP